MVRYTHEFLPFFLLITCVLVERTYCARPFSKELQKPAASPVAHGDELRRDEDRNRPTEKDQMIAGRGANADHGAVPPSSATILAVDGIDGAGTQRRWGGSLAQVVGDSVLHLKKLERRFLLAVDTDSAAVPSCGSNNVHIGCPPPSPH